MSPPLLLIRKVLVRVPARAWLWAFVAAAAVELAATGFGLDDVRWISKPALTLLLLGYLTVSVAPGQTAARLFGTGLLVACAADVALHVDGTAAFLIGMGLFGVVQVLYIAAFVKLGALRAFERSLAVPICYLVFWVGAFTALWTRLGALAAPVAVYGLLLVAMAALAFATGVVGGRGQLTGVGGLLFVVSDSLLGLGLADIELPASGLAVMATYTAAQLLLTVGTRRRLAAPG